MKTPSCNKTLIRCSYFFIIINFVLNPLFSQNNTLPITKGKWINSERNMVIEFYEKGNNINAKIISVKDSIDEAGEYLRDIYNENPKLRNRKIVGINLITELEGKKNGKKWSNGKYYFHETGNTYNCTMYLENDKLYIKGYWWWFKFLGRTREWSRLD